MYRYLGLLNWAMAKLRGEALVGNKYMDNPILVLKDAQEMQKEQESGRRGFITDAYTLEWVSAGLIRFHPEQLSRKDLVWCKTIIDKKLSNERFVAGAPAAVVELERKKKADAETKIAVLQETIASLKK